MKNNLITESIKDRRAISSTTPDVFPKIYQENINLVVWQKKLPESFKRFALALIEQKPNLKAVMTVSPKDTFQNLTEHLHDVKEKNEFCQQVALLVDMFCTLFDLPHAGLRLTVLNKPMCPRFHVDKVPCRLVTTFSGDATQWLANKAANRNKLGAGCQGLPDEESGLFQKNEDINHLSTGDIALLKGEGWLENNHGGLIHRSPASKNNARLLLTLDFIG